MARVEGVPSEEDEEPEVIIEDTATEQEEIDNESESSDDVSETDEAVCAIEDRLMELQEQLQKDSDNYDLQIEIIEMLEKQSDLDRLRVAFERLHATQQLRPQHWLRWTRLEAAIAVSDKEREAVHQLYQKATNEVYSIPIYLQWLMFAMSGNVEEARTTFEVITRRVGYDPTGSGDIWKAVTEFERLHLADISETDADALTEQVVRTAHCLAAQITRPLQDNEAAVEELRQLAETHAARLSHGYLDTILKQHEDFKEVKEKVSEFEDRLLIAELDEKVDIFTEYIETINDLHEENKDGPFNCLEMCAYLHDRATSECSSHALVSRLLSSYARLSRRLPPEEAARALDVCVTRRPTCADHWVLLMQHLERQGSGMPEIMKTLERALLERMSAADGTALWLGYLECLRRDTDFDSEERRQRLRDNLRHSTEALATMYGDEADADSELALFWARLEYKRLGDPARGKQIFEDLFLDPHKKCQSRLWLALLALEEARAPPPAERKLRDLHRRAVRCARDYPPAVCDAWRHFERERGTLETHVLCQTACEEALEEWRRSFELQKEAKQNFKKGKNKYKKQNAKRDGARDNTNEAAKGKKRGVDEDGAGGDGVKKQKREAKQNGVKRPCEAGDEAGDSKRARASDGSANTTTHGEQAHATPEKEACTLFVSNLDFKFSESSLREALSAYGNIAAMRFVRGVKAFGGSICYCEYTTPEAVDEAVKHDRAPLDGRPMFLSRYRAGRPSQASQPSQAKFRYATTPERNKLFVKNLPFSHCAPDKLRELFGPHGQLRDVRVVTHKNGRPKGLAYVEYADEKSASAALRATDGLLLEERHIDVALSAPPARETAAAVSLGQGRRDGSHPRRTQLSSLVPRVLQKPTAPAPAPAAAPAAASAATGPAPSTSKQMSNSDFRSLLLTKK